MTQLKVTVTVQYIEGEQEWTIGENIPNCATGGNPAYLAPELEKGLAEISGRLVGMVAYRFGDIRERTAKRA